MAARAGFSVVAHSSRATFQRCKAASLDGSSAKSAVPVSPRWSGSLRETVTEGSLDGTSQPDSSPVAITSGGSGGVVSDARVIFRADPRSPRSRYRESRGLFFSDGALGARRLLVG